MNSFALYRHPYGRKCTLIEQTEGEPLELPSCRALSAKDGFVLAPFQVDAEHPVLLIRPDKMTHFDTDEVDFQLSCGENAYTTEKDIVSKHADYAVDFANFHAQLMAGTFRKIVLSRCAEEVGGEQVSPVKMFERACRLYPRLFVALVYTPQSGLWMTATPEVLLERIDEKWHTMALAGTMKLEDRQLEEDVPTVNWSVKNIEEQRIVATYIMETLEHFSSDISEEGPRTARAANLVHLRSDFFFTLYNNTRVGELLQALHPTPAVCGLPKHEAFEFILHNEHTPRHYYSGFMGPIFYTEGNTHLYVSLRCMRIEGRSCHLYAGGGLLKNSTEEQEWQETEAKMETMSALLTPEAGARK